MPKKFPILLIDDDMTLLTLVQNAAKNSFPEAVFVQVTSTSEAKNHVYSFDDNRPALILLDIDFNAEENGFDVLKALRSNPKSATLPIVMLTNSNLGVHIMSAYNLGVSSFTNKPVSMDEWILYFATLRTYWLITVTLPPY